MRAVDITYIGHLKIALFSGLIRLASLRVNLILRLTKPLKKPWGIFARNVPTVTESMQVLCTRIQMALTPTLSQFQDLQEVMYRIRLPNLKGPSKWGPS